MYIIYLYRVTTSGPGVYWTYWLGASKVSDIPTYRWRDGTDISGAWIPLGFFTTPHLDALILYNREEWRDENPSNLHHFICEKGIDKSKILIYFVFKDACVSTTPTTNTTSIEVNNNINDKVIRRP